MPRTARAFPNSREVPLDPDHAALLIIDVQNLNCRREGAAYRGLDEAAFQGAYGGFFERLTASVVPNLARLVAGFRAAEIEVVYTVIENLTRDGRDRSLDYKISRIGAPRGSWDARVLDEIAPGEDEMVFPKSSSSVFISTNIHYVLQNLGVRSLAIAGLLTDQCVDSAVRDACDLGYLVTVVTDACTTMTQARHDWSLSNGRGYARQVTTAELLAEIAVSGGTPEGR
jgi:ureidoacrylate peracid hydrolase